MDGEEVEGDSGSDAIAASRFSDGPGNATLGSFCGTTQGVRARDGDREREGGNCGQESR